MRLMLPMWSKLIAVAHTLPYDAAIMGDFTIPGQLAGAVKVPTVVIAGEKTDPRLRQTAGLLAQAIPDAQLRILERQTHNVDPKVLSAASAEFFLRAASQDQSKADRTATPALLRSSG
jgi:hypothetical protein